ncbi:MAG: deoxyribonuclease IV [Pirellula sp.]|jgi:deoxyribonuclease-4|nr:deoxyribonuclease IV [Pirellula sp.]
MVKIGAHMSIAGGYYKAVEAAKTLGMDVVQLFTKNNNQWAAKPISEQDEKLFSESLRATGIVNPLAHASYLINLGSPKEELWLKSIDAMVIEWQRAEQLGLDGVVMHPGAYVESSPEAGLERIAQGIDRVFEKVGAGKAWLLLENTAGQGTCLGWSMEQLGWLLARSGATKRVGVCIDTCHAHAAGYDMSTPEGLKRLEKEGREFGVWESIRALHINDSKKGCGSRVDRHEHIGLGTIGIKGFERVLQHRDLKKCPMYLETEKGTNDEGEDWDAVNLRVLRSLV